MRLWHKNLIKLLPRKQLVSQWRECCLIAKLIYENGTPNHLLVNKILDYPLWHLCKYTHEVFEEMKKRGYQVKAENFDKYITYSMLDEGSMPTHEELFKGWHNDRYLTQCYYNLQEKYDCNGLTDDEWNTICREIVFTEGGF